MPSYTSQHRFDLDDALLDHARYNWVFFPIKRAASLKQEQDNTFKVPLRNGWQEIESTTDDELRAYIARHQVGISCGPSNLVVVDVDEKYIDDTIRKDADTVIARLKKVSDGAWARTPGGGYHFYFTQISGSRIRNRKLHAAFGHEKPWIETRGDGGYVVAYKRHDSTVTPVQCPDEILRATTGGSTPASSDKPRQLAAYTPPPDGVPLTVEMAAARVRSAQDGMRNETLNQEAYSLACNGIARKDIFAGLKPAALDAGLHELEIQKTIQSAVNGATKQIKQATEGTKEDERSAALFQIFSQANPHLVYEFETTGRSDTVPVGKWLEWQADHWESVSGHSLLRRIVDLSWRISKTPTTVLNQAQAIEKLLRIHRYDEDEWNTDPRYFLDSEGQLFDLLQRGYVATPTKEIRSYVRMGTTVDFSESEMWDRALSLWAGGDTDLIEYWQRIFGYCLIPGNPEQVFFYLHGPGKNGKSQFINVLDALFGEMAELISDELFIRSRSSADQRPDLALLNNKRVALVHELRQGAHWNEALLKRLTGERKIQVRPLYVAPYNIAMQAKIFLQGNAKPVFTDTSPGWQRRVQIVPFLNKIPDNQLDKYFFEKLRPDLPKIMGWAIRGYEKFQADGLSPSGAAMAATDRYITDYGNAVSLFIAERLTKQPEAKIPIKMLFEEYRKWREDQGDRNDTQLSSRGFKAHIEEMGLHVKQITGKTGRVYHLLDYEVLALPTPFDT